MPREYLIAAAIALSTASTVDAMPMAQYDRMNIDDKSAYDTLLIIGAKNALLAHGDTEQANKVIQLFLKDDPDSANTQLIQNLERIRLLNAKNAADPLNKQPLFEVEHAFYLTLKNNGINVPVSVLLGINKDFKPSQPAR